MPPLAVSAVLSPRHNTVLPIMLTSGSGLTITVVTAESLHKNAFVIVKEYDEVTIGVTDIEKVVSPVLHKYDPPPDPYKTAVSPRQISVSPTITGIGLGLTVIVFCDVFSQLLESVTVTL